ncbi:3-methyl-2-oxobutanoate hydroxymethyltransferase [Desulfatibacillum alkenivorans DSM 16219]|jgi:3-methyl-2-oxobutanoate hydroxymethyltransferase|uniref:3-methyl-2-oxobutanoate hydroxymethyltransferase n=1 Tax=Desulfatibacillum alkenivorans DSM 16219 TaxID=1121393 RepID=A0A1M6CNL9_9BACT|nr:3-methyl-2-oxobutanoate hydroxymethyltransferase [Desulfatibacillum alkenivorans]SHI62570.1 3-methyl-2-oxobutanoate hydroxymethyltransferase [Desulfatibacillum alkenivorans DSM 16219]
MAEKVTVTVLAKMKAEGEKITMLTAYDYPFARMVDECGVDMILVGDSLGMVVQGESSTLPVTMDQMVYHTTLVARAAKRAMVVGDMPFMSYQTSVKDAVKNAGRFIKEAGAAAVKLEGGAAVADRIKAISEAGIPVQAHIGLTPQSVHQMGGFKVQRQEERLLEDARIVQESGAFSVVLEGIPFEIAEKITKTLSISTIGIGAGVHCDGQVLVIHDALGVNEGHVPKFVKKYKELAKIAREGITEYVDEVKSQAFPTKEHSFK